MATDAELHAALEAAKRGDTHAMSRLAHLLRTRGDLDGAEEWYRRAAEAGDKGSMGNLGLLLQIKGDLGEAETWYRRGAEGGNITSIFNLAVLLKKEGDVVQAAEWYRRAADGGDSQAMHNLAILLGESGQLDEAKDWYRKAAEAGEVRAMLTLGNLLCKEDDLAGAADWFQRGAEAGDVGAMDNLAWILKNRGDLRGAETWLKRASEGGSTYAAEGLAELQRMVDFSSPKLESISFDTFGWEMIQNREGFRQWRSDDSSLVEQFLDVPPDFESWDADEIRQMITETLGFMKSPTFRLEDVPEQIRRFAPKELPEQVSLLEIELFEIQTAKCVQIANRHRSHGHVHYSAAITVLFAECFWNFALEIDEDEVLVGAREGAVAQRIMERTTTLESSTDEFDPYDRQWDGIVPLENYPLTRIRLLVARLRNSIQLRSEVLNLEPFAPHK